MGEKKDMQVTCIKCNTIGVLTRKPTVSKGIRYEYWYVQHVSFKEGKRKTRWCYIGKELPEEYQELIHKEHRYTQSDTQTNASRENLNLGLINENKPENTARAGSLARLGHLLDVQKVAGSNPARPTMLADETPCRASIYPPLVSLC